MFSRFLANLPIRSKLNLMMMSMSVGVLVLCNLAFLLLARTQIRERFENGARTLASITADNIKASLDFGDQEFATTLLRNLSINDILMVAVVFDHEGHPFAHYSGGEILPEDVPVAWTPGIRREKEALWIAHRVEKSGLSEGGMLVLAISYSPMHKGLIRNLVYAAVVLLIAGAVILRVTHAFHLVISNPLGELTNAADTIATKGEYPDLPRVESTDEIGRLIDAFGQMARRIRENEKALKEDARLLEIRVEERTRDLKVALEEAQAAERAKGEFLAVMSHELRTPLNPVLGFASLLSMSLSDETERGHVQCILESGERMVALIDRILEFCRVEKGGVVLQPSCFDLLAFLQDRVNQWLPQAKGLHLTLHNGLSEFADSTIAEGTMVICDQDLLARILSNLLDNACKFTPQGRVVLRVLCLRRTPEKSRIRFEVEDTGTGIPESFRKYLFKAFSQADASFSRQYEGVGLGLAICDRISKLLGGTIDVSSEVGKGSRFGLELWIDHPRD